VRKDTVNVEVLTLERRGENPHRGWRGPFAFWKDGDFFRATVARGTETI